MASDDDDHRRYHSSNPNNPFIAFRRFADSQVSSLLNTVFTLPATIANYRNVHVAREKCLSGRADKEKCAQLHEFDEATKRILAKCGDMYKKGDIEGALELGEDLLYLNYTADMLRKEIIEEGRGRTPTSSQGDSNSTNKLVEKVANEKGQQWASEWDWGFPKPFDAQKNDTDRRKSGKQWFSRNEEPDPAAEPSPPSLASSSQMSWEYLERNQLTHDFNGVLLPVFYELVRDVESATRQFHPHATPESTAVVTEMTSAAGVPRDAFEDLVRIQNGLPLMPAEHLGRSDHVPLGIWARRFFAETDSTYVGRCFLTPPPQFFDEQPAEEPSYEYAHDHEDQHDEPPSPKAKQGKWPGNMPETEMEAYERLLDPEHTSQSSNQTEGRPSVLSTLTTTERTVAPDGTVTTKVVLKKRFADGREESSETVHTQRGHEEETHEADRQPMLMEWAAHHRAKEQPRMTGDSKKTGWFWSN